MNFYYVPGAGLVKAHKLTWGERFRMRKIRRKAEKSWLWVK